MKVTITVLYSCHTCRLKDIPVAVPARETEDVLVWMDATGRLLGSDHHRRSPLCKTKVLNDVKIPITGTDRVGGAAAN